MLSLPILWLDLAGVAVFAVSGALVASRKQLDLVGFALLAAFTAVLIGVVRSGRMVACSCFGGLSSKPVSPLTLVRNVGLLLLAGLAVLA